MFHSNNSLAISFDTNLGRFNIKRDTNREQIFTLSLESAPTGELLLGSYCSISDAICAVSQQRTGHPNWDQLTPLELPSSVHNIASWNFQQNMGTLPRAACS